jgi:hypothetical protein
MQEYRAPAIDWRSRLEGPVVPGLHYHGYTWAGDAGDLASYKLTNLERRVEGPQFLSSDLPPELVAHYLLRPAGAHRRDQVWHSPAEAADWILERYLENPETQPYADPENTRLFHEVTLEHGRDTVWRWRVVPCHPRKFSTTVVCCPNQWDTSLACPLRIP